jgi:hypothetical protein
MFLGGISKGDNLPHVEPRSLVQHVWATLLSLDTLLPGGYSPTSLALMFVEALPSEIKKSSQCLLLGKPNSLLKSYNIPINRFRISHKAYLTRIRHCALHSPCCLYKQSSEPHDLQGLLYWRMTSTSVTKQQRLSTTAYQDRNDWAAKDDKSNWASTRYL